METGAVGFHRASHKRATRPISRVLYRARMGSAATAIHLGRLLPGVSCDQPGRLIWKRDWRMLAAAPPLFGLAPGGVCRASPVTRTAVRSYRTLSPLPRNSEAVCFLWQCPWGRPRRRLSGTVLPRSPDFPPCLLRWQLAERPSGLLTRGNKGFARRASSFARNHAGQALNAVSAMSRSSLRLAPPDA